MRTKTILLSALLGVFCSVSAMAQVFSINAVGYINLVVPTGFSIIANQLDSTNNNFSPLLDAQINAQNGNWDTLTFYKFANGGYTSLTVDSLSATPPWDPVLGPGGVVVSDPATNTTLNPGEACFINNNTGAPLTLTFVGSVRQGSLTNGLVTSPGGGYTMVSSQIPQAGRVDLDLGLTENDGDYIYIYNNTGTPATTGYYSYFGDSLGGSPSGWDFTTGAPQNPTVVVGQGFFYINNSGVPLQWVRSFSIN